MSILLTTTLLLGFGGGPKWDAPPPPPKPVFVTLGSEITGGAGASAPEHAAAALFADYLDDVYFERDAAWFDLSEPGATSHDILERQGFFAFLLSAITHPKAKIVVWIDPLPNDFWAVYEADTVNDACNGEIDDVYSLECYEAIAEVVAPYQHTLHAIAWLVTRVRPDVQLVFQGTPDPLVEPNCLIDGALGPDGTVLIPPEEVRANAGGGGRTLDCSPPPPPPSLGLDPDAPWSLNEATRHVAEAYGGVFVDNYMAFEELAEDPLVDLVGPDCRYPNDEGHAVIYSRTVQRFEEALFPPTTTP